MNTWIYFDYPSVSKVQSESSTLIFSGKSLLINYYPEITIFKCCKDIVTFICFEVTSEETGIYMCNSVKVWVQVYLSVVPPFPIGAGPVSSSFFSSLSEDCDWTAGTSIFFSTGLTTCGAGLD